MPERKLCRLVEHVCPTCLLSFWVTESVANCAERTGRAIFCPSGHAHEYESVPAVDDDRLRDLHDQEQAEAAEAEHRGKGAADAT